MKNAFFEATGEGVDLYSDIGARFQAVASELYSLSCYEDFVLKQAFPHTATGKYLDYHAQLRSKSRKEPLKARGVLTFSLNEPLENDVEIPAGTICSIKEQPFIQFETDENAVILAGECFVDVKATALGAGEKYNASVGTINAMVNPPISVDRVTNNCAFIGGVDAEGDEKLRRRILKSYKVPQNGVTLNSISQSIESIDGVLDCVVYYDDGVYSAYVKTPDNTIDGNIYALVEDAFTIALLLHYDVIIDSASPKDINLKVLCKSSNKNKAELDDMIKRSILDCFDSVGIGESMNVDRLIMCVAKIDDIDEVEIFSPEFEGGFIPLQNNEFLKLGKLEVSLYD